MLLRGLVLVLILAACTPGSVPAGPREFERWLAAVPERAPAFARFEAMLQREGVAGVLESRELWLTDRLAPECVVEPFTMPPEALWPRILPALRFIRDHVEPAVGEVAVASGFRDEAFNACVGGASRSAHRGYYALDVLPLDRAVSRERLIETLCPIHAREGRRLNIGLGIYNARRFHVDAHGYRGWGHDHRGATFPCVTES
jgi:hypothetical protein